MEKWTNINEKQILTKEFSGKRVVTFKDVDLVHERVNGTASRNFRSNKEHFIENEDFYIINITNDEIRRQFGVKKNAGRQLILLTETGYLMLVKSFTDDLAWKVQRELVNVYFNVHHLKVEQSKLQEPYKLTKKFYNGNPVMVLKDLEFLIGTSVHTIGYILKSNNQFTIGVDYFLLEGKELKNFKKNNDVSKLIGSLIVIPKQGVDKLLNLLLLKPAGELRETFERYFELEKPVPQGKNKVPVLEQLQACKFIADDLKVGEAVKMSIYRMVCEKNGIGTAVVDKIEHRKKLDKEVKEITMKYGVYLLEHFTTHEIIDMKNQWVYDNNVKSEKVKSYMLKLFDIIIKISTKTKRTA
ncbi:MAG: ORF6N domain-containing protein [Clostridium sp.]|jgi:hypothetical protein|uniref:ORF6N domain-containing protein n=1 Tax=Clostridium sp. TaxID=1506 RepID=UPI0025C04248|nr:ORF6N domain-containing protein [Clostridium sp.]MCH3963009.1 ORF6N domain-containing protein [Clostridium sp.]MCI1800218.1 ORF6N domain-containing protein [Clostridium sp.]MCI2202088.1 ORF6N domain-containing protein [Clostridium sp.]